MTDLVLAYTAPTPKAALEKHMIDLAPLGAREVEVEVLCCSICHSDLHLLDGDWRAPFPLVPGHEIVGTVTAVGSETRGISVGTRVGIGWQCGACHQCRMCKAGQEQLCQGGKRRTCVGRPGGFAERVRADFDFCFPIPSPLSSEHAAPLMCAGLTVFAPLKRHLIGTRPRVGIVGIGGLGHLAVQFAAAMGCEVTAFDPVDAKAEEARQLGAARFVSTQTLTTKPSALDAQFDFILSTTHAPLDWNLWLSLLDLNGTLCLVGVPPTPLAIDPDHLLDGQKKITGSVVGSPDEMRAMLAFAAAHGIAPWIETAPMADINTAVAKLRRGEARYRIVLRTSE